MLYQRRVFTCPASGLKTSDINWDRAFLTPEQFSAKYAEEPECTTLSTISTLETTQTTNE